MYAGHSYQAAIEQARTNARYFGRSYFVSTDTSGNYHVEPVYPAADAAFTEVTEHGDVIRRGPRWRD